MKLVFSPNVLFICLSDNRSGVWITEVYILNYKAELPVVHQVMASANRIEVKINVISSLSNLIAELSLSTKWHMTCCTWSAFGVLHVTCTQLHLGRLSVCVGDSSRHSEEIVQILNCAFQCDCYDHYDDGDDDDDDGCYSYHELEQQFFA